MFCKTLSLKNEPISLLFTDFYFLLDVLIRKNVFWKIWLQSHHFVFQTGKNYTYCKVTAQVLICCLSGLSIDFQENKLQWRITNHDCFFNRFSTEVDVFVKYPENFLHFLLDDPVSCCPEKPTVMKHCSIKIT